MQALARWAGYLALLGGALVVLIAAVVAVDPSSQVWYAFFVPVFLLGLAVFGLQERARAATGRLGAASAWFVGSLGFAAAVIRARVHSAPGAWLVIIGALAGAALSITLGANSPVVGVLLFALFGVGWLLIGYGALRPSAQVAT